MVHLWHLAMDYVNSLVINTLHRWFAILLLIATPPCMASETLRVVGLGATPAEARADAFRKAIETYLGTVIVSNFEVVGGAATRNEILAYSAGYVDSYTVVNQSVLSGKVQIVVDVVVSSSRLQNRILSSSSGVTPVPGPGAIAQVDTWTQTKVAGDRLVSTVFSNWPEYAFNVRIHNQSIRVDEYRTPYLQVNYRLEWNQNWLSAFKEALFVTSDPPPKRNNPEGIIIFLDNPGAILDIGRWTAYGYNDWTSFGNIRRLFIRSETRIRVQLLDSGRVVSSQCEQFPTYQFYDSKTHAAGTSAIKVYPKNSIDYTSRVGFPKNFTPNLLEVKIDIVKNTWCNTN